MAGHLVTNCRVADGQLEVGSDGERGDAANSGEWEFQTEMALLCMEIGAAVWSCLSLFNLILNQ